jgi:hypothetical protein
MDRSLFIVAHPHSANAPVSAVSSQRMFRSVSYLQQAGLFSAILSGFLIEANGSLALLQSQNGSRTEFNPQSFLNSSMNYVGLHKLLKSTNQQEVGLYAKYDHLHGVTDYTPPLVDAPATEFILFSHFPMMVVAKLIPRRNLKNFTFHDLQTFFILSHLPSSTVNTF